MEYFTEKLMKDLTFDEGCKYETYLCSENHLTAGIGHLILKSDDEYGKPVGTAVSKDKVGDWFDKDIEVTINDCKKIFKAWDTLPEDAKLVTANMCFQLGMPRLSKFRRTIDACNDHRWSEMASEMRNSRWHKQTKARAERLIKRILALESD
tara:strand:- start:3442 stop:3897 length:456 start_codon:yes stop_codon:yes gene_type:complete